MSARRAARQESRAASFFLLLGCLTVLGGAFTGGVFAGRQWPGLLPSIGNPREAALRASGKPPSGRPAPAGPAGPTARPAEPPPVLTFYQELTAPLTAPPPAPKPKPVERAPRAESLRIDSATVAGESAKVERASAERRFSVQVGAFRTREQADAIRTKLVSAGHDAYITEGERSTGTRYRVRAGSFTSREEALRAAERIGAAVKLATYVTIR
ncbi:MAG TPA: SPOR domain-containing protein [Methylomirabilota bacterium]|nr:SPOR domain-containing protein [Methylomirabilota bacterium]